MKTITLQRLTLRNFKGFTFDLEPTGNDTDISGRNATGKTTLADAFSWLLFGKDSLGRADFEIKNLDSDGNKEHGIEHEVEGILSIDNTLVALKRVYHEVWTKKRGTAQSTLTGNATEYFIDGVPAKENEYKSRIAEIMGSEEQVKLLTSPTAFPALPWQRQRSLLLEVCGDITDAQVIATDESLAPLIDLLKKYTVSKTPLDDLRKVVMGRRTEINKQIDQLPVRIDEVHRGLPDISGLNKKEIETDIARLETSLSEAKLRLSGIDNGGNIAELSKKLSIINADISKMEQAYYEDGMKVARRLSQQILSIEDTVKVEERVIKETKENINYKQGLLEAVEAKLSTLRDKWVAVDAETFQDSTNDTCPACLQPLPVERVQDARDKALANFNRGKAERLSGVEAEGKLLALGRDTYTVEIARLHESLQDRPVIDSDELENLISQRDTVKNMADDYSGIPGRIGLVAQRNDLEFSIDKAKGFVSVDKDKIYTEIAELNGLIAIAKTDGDKFTRREQGEIRIKELKAEEKKLAKEYEDLERQLFLIESFIKTKVRLLTDRINSKFEIARFKLFEVQVNGGISECCEITVNGVGYNSNLNSGARINVGLDVCRTLAQHYGLLAPIFVDNAESVCELTNVEAQMIRLVVSERDAVLRVETAEKRMAA